MTDTARKTMKSLDVLVGEWRTEPTFERFEAPPDAHGRVTFEWMEGGRFLVERFEVSIPEAPDGIALIGYDEGRGTLLQHYFDSRGVARIYEMTLDDDVWTLSRTAADFSPLDFAQRFTGRFNDDGTVIDGTWEICQDGSTWEKDFDLRYVRTGAA